MTKTDIGIYRGLKEKFDPEVHVGFFITSDTGELLLGDQSLGQTISGWEINNGVLTLQLNTGEDITITFPEATETVKGLLSAEDKAKLVALQGNLDSKVDKVTGKSLVEDALITKLTQLPTSDTLTQQLSDAKAAGDNAQSDLNAHKQNKSNPHEVTKTQVGLGNVTNDAQVKRSEMGVAGGVATLDTDGKVPASQLPSYVDDIIDVYATYTKSGTGVLSNITLYLDAAHTQLVTGEAGKIYQNIAAGEPNYQFRWTGTVFSQTGASSLIIGEVAGTAYDGAKGKTNADNIAKIQGTKLSHIKDDTPITTSADKVAINYECFTGAEYGNASGTQHTAEIPAATTEKAGVMSAADKQTLDKIWPVLTIYDIEEGLGTQEQVSHNTSMENLLRSRHSQYQNSIATITLRTTEWSDYGYDKPGIAYYSEENDVVCIHTFTEANGEYAELHGNGFVVRSLSDLVGYGTYLSISEQNKLSSVPCWEENFIFNTNSDNKYWWKTLGLTLIEEHSNGTDIAAKLIKINHNDWDCPAIAIAYMDFSADSPEYLYVYELYLNNLYSIRMETGEIEETTHYTMLSPRDLVRVGLNPSHTRGSVLSTRTTSKDSNKKIANSIKEASVGIVKVDETLPGSPSVLYSGFATYYLDSVHIVVLDENAYGRRYSLNPNTGDLILVSKEEDRLVPAGGHERQVLTWKDDGQAKWEDMSNLFTGLEELLAYGVEWDVTVTDPHLTRIGNMSLHKTLPIQSLLKGCIAQGDKIMYWLDEDDWTYKKGGNPNKGESEQLARLDGYDGTVRIYCPNFYIKSQIIGNKRRVWLSTVKIDNTWTYQHEILVDAYRCTVLNSVPADMGYLSTLPVNSAISVVNTAAYCRGGGNRADRDTYLETDPFRTDLGKPRTNQPRSTFRTECRNAGNEMLSYDQYKNIFYWLYVVEYANFNCLEAYNADLTDDGYRQGGMGSGVTTWSDAQWSAYNNYYPITPCGYGNDLGNRTGIKKINIPETTSGSTVVTAKTFDMPRWRGFDNPFGDIWTNLDGIIIDADADNHPNNMNYVYTCQDPTKYADNLNGEGYEKVGEEIHLDGYTKLFDLGDAAHIIPNVMGGSTTQYKCDYHWTGSKNTTLRTLLVGGSAYYGAAAGLGSFDSGNGVSRSWDTVGFRSVSRFLSFSSQE